MATPYEMDLLGNAATGAYLGVSDKIPEEEQDNNEDLKKLKYIRDVVLTLDSKIDKYLDYDTIVKDIDDIERKYGVID
ncbi:MAG: hypothetical protein LBD61_02475 [Endomicrobium sp.]|jgi:hydrogenase maturation factor HypF (carbamoyltransferase family)|nr:hypothetical protein [Endomicrobium sp.]